MAREDSCRSFENSSVESIQNAHGDFAVWYWVGQAGMVTVAQAPFIYAHGDIMG